MADVGTCQTIQLLHLFGGIIVVIAHEVSPAQFFKMLLGADPLYVFEPSFSFCLIIVVICFFYIITDVCKKLFLSILSFESLIAVSTN